LENHLNKINRASNHNENSEKALFSIQVSFLLGVYPGDSSQ